MHSLIEPAPKWSSIFEGMDFIKMVGQSKEKAYIELLDRVNNEEYLYWDNFKQICKLTPFTTGQYWGYLRFSRNSAMKKIGLLDTANRQFGYWIPDGIQKKLHYFEHSSGQILYDNPEITADEKERFFVSSLMEEAIASSQIEGASTTREVAKDMLRSGRKPKDHAERMIYNNYQMLLKIKDITSQDMSITLLCSLQALITENTLEDPKAAGRLRTSEEKIYVSDDATGERLHEPPPANELESRLKILCDFINKDEEYGFVHPVIKAIIIHFWLAYDHPFVDGNGRTARALFYWYLMKKKYWAVGYLCVSISRIIKQSIGKYKKSYLYAEHDEQDITYFLDYNMNVLCKALDELKSHMDKRSKDYLESIQVLSRYRGHKSLNYRQTKLLFHALRNQKTSYTIETHMNIWNITYQTARTDLLDLEERKFLVKTKRGREFIFLPSKDLDKKLRT